MNDISESNAMVICHFTKWFDTLETEYFLASSQWDSGSKLSIM